MKQPKFYRQSSQPATYHHISNGKSLPAAPSPLSAAMVVNAVQRKPDTRSFPASVVQFGKQKKKGKKGSEPIIESSSSVTDEESLTEIDTPAKALQAIFDIELNEAEELLAYSTQFAILNSKNTDALNFIVSDKGKQKRLTEGITEKALEAARESVEKYNLFVNKYGLSEDLAYFATHHADRFEGMDASGIEELSMVEQVEGDETAMVDNPEFNHEDVFGGLEREQEEFYANLPKEGGGGSGDWALGSVRSEAKKLAQDSPNKAIFKNGTYTVHHKMSRSHLKKLKKHMDDNSDVSAPFKMKLQEIGNKELGGASNIEKILVNLPFNLEVGPSTNLRKVGDDPGEEFDANQTPSGAMTPRSEILNNMDREAVSGAGTSTQDFWNALTEKLEELRELQESQLDKDSRVGSKLSKPKLEQWKADSGKFKRND